MYQEDRLRRLGDRIKDEWQGTVIDGGPRWSGNIPVRKDECPVAGDAGRQEHRRARRSITPMTVHALLLLYDKDAGSGSAHGPAGRGRRSRRTT